MQMLEALVATARKLGPYVLLEVLLPGGTLFAMTLFVYRNPAAARGYFAKARKSGQADRRGRAQCAAPARVADPRADDRARSGATRTRLIDVEAIVAGH